MESICECKYNLIKNDFVEGNKLLESSIGEITNILSNSNLDVLKCFKNIFKLKNIYKGVGGLIMIGILVFDTIFGIKFLLYDINAIMRYLYYLTNSYIDFLSKEGNNKKINDSQFVSDNSKNKIKSPPRKIKNNYGNDEIYSKSQIPLKNDSKCTTPKISKKKLSSKFGFNYVKSKKITRNKNKERKKTLVYKNSNIKEKRNYFNNNNELMNKNNIINIEEYLEDNLDEMDFDNALKKDKRSFCQFYTQRLKTKNIFANLFCNKDNIRPFSIKFLLLLLNIDLYFVINGLFFSEEYIIELFHLEKEDKFFDFIPRSYSRFFYATIVGVILDIIIDCIFVEENKIKRIFLRNKNDLLQMKYEISKTNKSIRTRYKIFIFICIFVSIISWYYVSCFNNVYSGVKLEWIKSSIVIIIIMQILSCLIVLTEALLRQMSFEFKSEQIFKFKQILS